jgi:DNA polymerase-1
MKTLLLVDGTAYVYRAFHAMPDLRTSRGEPTGAVRGFIAMLRTLRQEIPGEYCACVFDAKGKTFRDELYPEYKAHRPPMPGDLAAQLDLVRQAAHALGWPVLEVPGVEADDVLATLARRAEGMDFRVVIASGDKDLAQLVDERVTLIDTMSRDGGPPRRLDRAGVVARFGVPPERIVDFLTLVGDTVDNVKGVEKVGPKTAARWLQQYGSLDALVAASGEVGGVVGEKLREALGRLPLVRRLVTVLTDVALDPAFDDLESLRLQAADREALRALYARCEFRSWQRELETGTVAKAEAKPESKFADPPAPPATPETLLPTDLPFECVTTPDQLQSWIDRVRAAPLVAIDTETTSLDPMQAALVGISLSTRAGEGCYIPVGHCYAGVPAQLPRDGVLEALRAWLEDEGAAKVGQNAKYDSHVFANAGVRLAGVAHDTLLESYVLEAHRPHDMDSLAARHLGRRTITFEEVCGKGAKAIGFAEVELARATQYAAEDAEVTLALHQALYPRVAAEEGLRRVYERIEIPVSRVLFAMERRGVLVDPDLLRAQSADLARRIHALETEARTLAGQDFNLSSPRQIGEILFGKLGLPVVKKTAGGAPSTDEEVLEKLAEDYPLPRLLLEHRMFAKLRSTYCEKLPAMVNPGTGRVHTSYGQGIAITGRLASSDPNLQNIPVRTPEGRRIREAFIAPPGSRIVSADYSQIELRIMAHICGDPGLVGAFARGEDVHRATAAEVFGIEPAAVDTEQRRAAKVINFGLIYGMTAFGLAANLGIGRDAAKLYIDRYFQRYPGVARYMDETRARARDLGYVETAFGRRLWLPEIRSPNGPRRQAAERAAINAPMQGTAADLVKLAMIECERWLAESAMAARLVMQVHDELVFEVPEGELGPLREQLPRLMCGVADWSVPLEVQVGEGRNWEEAHR